jgi:hypothetical protein
MSSGGLSLVRIRNPCRIQEGEHYFNEAVCVQDIIVEESVIYEIKKYIN